jgi:predicted transcriptional regulator
MVLTIELSDDQSRRLKDLARSLSIEPSELAHAAVANLVNPPRDDFDRAAAYVLEKNRELYKRLS